jgi:undecaprenyl-diphosphatase
MTGPSPPQRMQWRFIAAILLLAAVWFAMLLGGANAIDLDLYEALYAGRRPLLVPLARAVTFLGEPTLLIGASILVAAWLWRAGRGRMGLVLLTVTLTGRALSEMQKYWIGRVRPGLEPHLVAVKTSSFPSGHATSSMIFYLCLAMALTTNRSWNPIAVAGAVLLSLLIGTSRVMLGVHWPSDVVGGWAFGALWFLLTVRPAERLLRSDSEMDRTAL